MKEDLPQLRAPLLLVSLSLPPCGVVILEFNSRGFAARGPRGADPHPAPRGAER